MPAIGSSCPKAWFDMTDAYENQVRLLLRILPFVAEEGVFALKGGTAINLFERNIPRLSVDIDLTYLPFKERPQALTEISEALSRIKARVETNIPAIRVTKVEQGSGIEAKLHCQHLRTQIKIEVNTIIRGHLLPPRTMTVRDMVQERFEAFAEMPVVSRAELYGGKLCAALDRQHPRDLFDVHQLLEQEGLTREIMSGLLAAVLSHPRPINEVLFAAHKDQRETFDRQFAGMALAPFTYAEFEAARSHLHAAIGSQLTATDKALLLSFKNGTPDWTLSDLPNLERMPAIQWKLSNIRKLKATSPAKHRNLLEALRRKLA
jgi:predicted nucleotidyltransferase component of viral defense system